MKKTVCGWLACLFAVLLLALEPPVYAVAVEDVSVSAECAVLMEAETGRVLYAKNADQPAAMASTTKIMTAWLTLEVAAVQDDVVTITEEMVAVEGSLDTHLLLEPVKSANALAPISCAAMGVFCTPPAALTCAPIYFIS